MEARAVARYIRMSPKKVRRVADVVRGLPVNEALAVLRALPQRGARVIEKAIRSAVANAEHNLELDRDTLVVSRISVDRGPGGGMWKRLWPRARGRADIVRRHTCHVTVVVAERE
ncbi:MAG: 50S ribosomal protein L22 [Armatimonadota bacterium]|nr:50S ribosomal protein L22 [Armatimonadota bacterium]MDR7562663.1 50S ribosomal protein L22 [Armatimonadota bacterium]MDR7567538.1 50S ribosomal protein L22 [Armatimonadota bacterium]MDR7601774.1 50S ribosomal protein L22 [Armatimonadota bacterium]